MPDGIVEACVVSSGGGVCQPMRPSPQPGKPGLRFQAGELLRASSQSAPADCCSPPCTASVVKNNFSRTFVITIAG